MSDDLVLEDFIAIYESETCLWKLKSKEYHDRTKRSVAIKRLLLKLKESKPSAIVADVKSKINSLRTCYKREKKKVEDSLKSGSGTDEVYNPKLWYYGLMSFIDDQDEPRKSFSNLSDSEVSIHILSYL